MTRRSLSDPVWADQVVDRWQRRRWRVQQREKAMVDLRTALVESPLGRFMLWLERLLG